MLHILFIIIFSFYLSYPVNKNLDELSDDIVLLHINDVHCGINNTIGYDGYALYYDELKTKYKNVIKVDIGDHIQGGTIGPISEGDSINKIMNKIGFDVATLGNHEFDYGIEQLFKLNKNLTIKYICANFCYRKNKTTIFDPYKIIEAGNKKIGFIGVLTPYTFSKTYLSSILDENGEPLYDFLNGNNGQELYDTIQNHINKLRNDEKIDYIILLSHTGMKNGNRIEFPTENLISNLEGVDAILDGHSHVIYNTTTKDKNWNNIPISQVGTNLQAVGTLILKNDGNITSEILSEIPEPKNKSLAILINRDKERWVNKEIYDYIIDLWKEYNEELNVQFGFLNFDFIVMSSDSSFPYCRYQECTLGNLITDAIKTIGNGEFTIINGGSIRNNMYKGNLTRGGIISVLPWFNNIVMKRVTGQCILDALEFGVSKLPDKGGLFQLSGITFDADLSINSSVIIDSTGMFLNITGKRRVSNVKINGKVIDIKKIYNASLIEYIANGGSGYSMFTDFEVFNESLITDTDALSYYIKNNLNGNIPEDYKNAQGRINLNYNSSSASSSSFSPSPFIKLMIIFISLLMILILLVILKK